MRLFRRFVAAVVLILALLVMIGLLLAFVLDLSTDGTNSIHQFVFENQPNDAAFSPDGQRIAVAAEGYCRLHIFETDTGRQVQQIALCPDERLWGLASVNWSPDGERVVVTRVRSPDVWIVDVSRSVVIHSLVGHSQQVEGATYSHDGHYIISYGDGGVTVVWDAEVGHLMRHLDSSDHTITDVAVSPDDRTLATASSDGLIRLWDLQNGVEVDQLIGHQSTVYTLAFSEDGQYLASGGIDTTVRIWRVDDGAQVQRQVNPSWVMKAYFLNDDTVLFSNWLDGGISLWNTESNGISAQFSAGLESRLVALSSSRSLFATIWDYRVELWELPDSG